MDERLWHEVDAFLDAQFVGADEVLQAAVQASRAAGLPSIQVSPTQGKFLMLLARSIGARRILEIGTLGGYSSIWLARGLPPGGRLVSCELQAAYASVARANLQRAGLAALAEVRVGPASATLAALIAERVVPFDLIFIDADKSAYPDYLAAALQLSHPGTVIIGDNVVREGEVLDARSTDSAVRGVRRFLQLLATDQRLCATALQTVGEKGHDGFSLAIVRAADDA